MIRNLFVRHAVFCILHYASQKGVVMLTFNSSFTNVNRRAAFAEYARFEGYRSFDDITYTCYFQLKLHFQSKINLLK